MAGTDNPVPPSLDIVLSQRVADVKQYLADLADSGSAVLGLHGMGGIGKTVLATAVFEEMRSDFVNCCCFLEVGQSADDAALMQLQTSMLWDLCGARMQLGSATQGYAVLTERLNNARVLLVIDGILSSHQRDALLVTVGEGSRVLVTSCNADLLRCPSIDALQPVDPLGQAEALEMFRRHAQPTLECSDLAASMAEACCGLALTLRVVGSLLQSQQHRRQWEQALQIFRAVEGPSGGAADPLVGRLRLSYDALDKAAQEMFLDIACFMLGKDARACLPVWGPLADSTLRELVNRSLVGVDGKGRLAMHDILRVMGRAVVVEENSEPAQRSRLWMPDSVQAFDSLQVWPSPGICLPEYYKILSTALTWPSTTI